MKNNERIILVDKGVDRYGRQYELDAFNNIYVSYGIIGVREDTKIFPEKISHMFQYFETDKDGTVSAILKILETQQGKVLQALIDNDCKISPYISGIGVYNDFTNKVSSYLLVAIDVDIDVLKSKY